MEPDLILYDIYKAQQRDAERAAENARKWHLHNRTGTENTTGGGALRIRSLFEGTAVAALLLALLVG